MGVLLGIENSQHHDPDRSDFHKRYISKYLDYLMKMFIKRSTFHLRLLRFKPSYRNDTNQNGIDTSSDRSSAIKGNIIKMYKGIISVTGGQEQKPCKARGTPASNNRSHLFLLNRNKDPTRRRRSHMRPAARQLPTTDLSDI
uniref:Uncharacterized protein n=1 Tax=Vespula pensylvanica TaxID=30213 RepID=A0A834P4E7_VESPE|nr:hypothetical protein H0235_007264 [Vespula pensylvanica]